MTTAQYIEIIKNKKKVGIQTAFFEYPNRLASVSLSGSLSYTDDQRLYSSASSALTATMREYSANYSSLLPYTREFFPKFPIISPVLTGGAKGVFRIYHTPVGRFWQVSGICNNEHDNLIIGTITTKVYERPTTSDPWVESSSTSDNITSEWTIKNIGGGVFSGGGDPASGGQNGIGDEQKLTINIRLRQTNLPILPSIVEIYRLPWDNAWLNDTTTFPDAFNDEIAARNTTDGGGHTGSCSLAVNFAF